MDGVGPECDFREILAALFRELAQLLEHQTVEPAFHLGKARYRPRPVPGREYESTAGKSWQRLEDRDHLRSEWHQMGRITLHAFRWNDPLQTGKIKFGPAGLGHFASTQRRQHQRPNHRAERITGPPGGLPKRPQLVIGQDTLALHLFADQLARLHSIGRRAVELVGWSCDRPVENAPDDLE